MRARREGRPTAELLVLYVRERFLYRPLISGHGSQLVLEGGMLLAAFDEGRPTADIDLLATAVADEVETISPSYDRCSPSKSTTASSSLTERGPR
ncbi:MAG: nucleotidyl transferase AbiEii/AbiGii toxin family protein [Actinobacteria bacterium]|nr:nucleotidyl transferase AbiEii/AbiGii toxin family protein [Actinomycetota bacterium]